MRTTLRNTIASTLLLTCLVPLATARAGAAQDTQAGAPAVQPPAPQTLDGILRELASYDGGVDSEAVWWLRDYVYARKDDPVGRAECEAKLVQFLGTEANQPGHAAAAKYLRVIAGDAAVPALARLVENAWSADRARAVDHALYVLQSIPGSAADQALVKALDATTGETTIAVIAALGERRVTAAVQALAPLLQQPDLASAAAVALGRIGGHAAVAPLIAGYSSAKEPLRTAMAGALLEAAPGFELGQEQRRIYDTLAEDTSRPASQRLAALAGRIRSTGDVRRAVLEMLSSPDALAREAALSQVSLAFFPDTIAELCARLPKLGEGEQIVLINALATYPEDGVVPAFLEATRSPSHGVRLAAWNALGAKGDASIVPVLADAAATARGEQQKTVRSALGSLKGRAVDDAMVALLHKEPPETIQGELLLAAGERRIYLARSLAAEALGSSSEHVRVQALRALQAIGTPSDADAVLDLLLAAEEDPERIEAAKTVADLARMTVSADGRSRAVRTRLAAEKDTEARSRLIGLLPLMGDPAALPVLRSALADPDQAVVDAAVRAIVAWPTSDARDDILTLARGPRNETHRLLALAGFVRVVRLDRHRSPRAAVADLRLAAELSWRPEEQKLVLGALAQFPCREGLDLAAAFLRDEETRAEAQAAIDAITPRLPKEAIRQ